MNALRTVFRYWLWLMALAVVVQIGFAGIGAFSALDAATDGSVDEDTFLDKFELHAALGTFLLLGGLLTLLLALAARTGKQRVLHSLGLFVLLIVQVILGWTGSALPAVLGFLHPINALLILGAVVSLAAREWRGDRMTVRGAPETMSPPPSPAA